MNWKVTSLRPRNFFVSGLQHRVDLAPVGGGRLGAGTCDGDGRGRVGETCGVD